MSKCLDGDGIMKKDWKDVSPATKADFLTKNHKLMGEALKTALLDVIVAEYVQAHGETFSCGGGWSDEKTLEDKYKHDPQIAKNIVANSRSFFCSVKGRVLYHDIEYESWNEIKKEYVEKRKLEASQESAAKKAKTVKPKVENNPDQENKENNENNVLKDFSTGQTDKLNKLKDELAFKTKELQTSTLQISHETVKEEIPTSVLRKARLIIGEAEMYATSLELALNQGKAADPKGLHKDGQATLKEVTACIKKNKHHLDAALEELEMTLEEKPDGTWQFNKASEEGA